MLEHGDLSVLSFHATKVFNTFEGGAIVCPDAKTKQRIDHLKNFGYRRRGHRRGARHQRQDERDSTRRSACCNCKHVDDALEAPRASTRCYREGLDGVHGIRCLDGAGDDTSRTTRTFRFSCSRTYPLSRDALFEQLRDARHLSRAATSIR